MSSRIFQNIILQMKSATDRCIGVIDREGNVVASSDPALLKANMQSIWDLLEAAADQVTASQEKTLKLLDGQGGPADYAVFVEGEDEIARSICILASVAFQEAKMYYEEKYNRSTFVKNIISENILPGDIYVRAKELHFELDLSRAVILIRQLDKLDTTALELLRAMYPDNTKDFVLNINETDIVLILQIAPGMESRDLMKIADSIEERIRAELNLKTVIGVGTMAKHLRELADRYKEAQVAIEVGKVFEAEKSVIHYENLGIGRLIYQLPVTLCEMFLGEIFKKSPIDSLDQETLYTINKFFENNLNVSETSRRLFVHRNTLVYRLDKIKRLTGLDLREFDHAIVFKVALMVKKYLIAQNAKY